MVKHQRWRWGCDFCASAFKWSPKLLAKLGRSQKLRIFASRRKRLGQRQRPAWMLKACCPGVFPKGGGNGGRGSGEKRRRQPVISSLLVRYCYSFFRNLYYKRVKVRFFTPAASSFSLFISTVKTVTLIPFQTWGE